MKTCGTWWVRNFKNLLAWVLLGSTLGAMPGMAAEAYWTNVAGGQFSTPANWKSGVAGAVDNAIFSSNATYQVSWTANSATSEATFMAGVVTQAIGGFRWQITNFCSIGGNSSSTGYVAHPSGTLTVTNAAGKARLQIGIQGKGTYLLNGGTLTADYLIATNNSATLTNSIFLFTYGTLNTTRGVTIGSYNGNSFSVGTVSNQTATWNISGGTNYFATDESVAQYIGATGGRGIINVSGPGTLLVMPQPFIGSSGAGCQLNLRNGAWLRSVLGMVGFNPSASNSVVVVDGVGSAWTNTSNTFLGNSSPGNLVLITNGGRFYSGATTIGSSLAFYLGHNNTVAVSGPGSTWTNFDYVMIGGSASGNRLIVENGGRVDNLIAQIGFGINQSNCMAYVSGPGSVWKSTALTVGVTGTNNQLIVNGGTVIATSLIVGRNSSATGSRLMLTNGLLLATNTVASPGILEVRRGTFVMTDGVVTADRLLFTNALANFMFAGGRINSKGTALTTGAPLTVGNGLVPATYNLVGGTHTFSGGLNLSANAQLTGAGTIIGSVISDGTIAPGDTIGTLTINGNLQVNSGELVFQINGIGQSDILSIASGFYGGGNLRIALAQNFTPAPGDQFPIIGFSFRSGDFLNVSVGGRVTTTDGCGSFLLNDTGTALYLSDYQSNDTDGDGIADAWTQLYFGFSPLPPGTGLNQRDGDNDGDGMSNYQEFMAGTNPQDPGSQLKLIPVLTTANQLTLEFDGIAGRTYQIQYSTNLQNWATLPIVGFDESVAPARRWTDDGILTGSPPSQGGSPRFYRVTVE